MNEGLPVVVYLLCALISLLHTLRAGLERNDSACLGWATATIWAVILAGKHAGAI